MSSPLSSTRSPDSMKAPTAPTVSNNEGRNTAANAWMQQAGRNRVATAAPMQDKPVVRSNQNDANQGGNNNNNNRNPQQRTTGSKQKVPHPPPVPPSKKHKGNHYSAKNIRQNSSNHQQDKANYNNQTKNGNNDNATKSNTGNNNHKNHSSKPKQGNNNNNSHSSNSNKQQSNRKAANKKKKASQPQEEQSGKMKASAPPYQPLAARNIQLLQPSDFPALSSPTPMSGATSSNQNTSIVTPQKPLGVSYQKSVVIPKTKPPSGSKPRSSTPAVVSAPPSSNNTLQTSDFPSLSSTTASDNKNKPAKPKFVALASTPKSGHNNKANQKKDVINVPQNKKATKPSTTTTTTQHHYSGILRPTLPPPTTQGGAEHAFFRLLQEGKMSVVPKKGRQRLRPRKKKFSPLKKKVLEERLKQWRQQSAAPISDSTTVTGEDNNDAVVVCVRGFCDAEEVEDDDEYSEICENLREMAEKAGALQRVWVPKQPPPDESSTVPVFCQFVDPTVAAEATTCWQGLNLGGNSLEVTLLPNTTSIPEAEEEWHEWCMGRLNETSAEEAVGEIEIALSNALTEDDLEDEECLEESVSDIRIMASSYGTLQNLQTESDGRVILAYQCNLLTAKDIVSNLNRVIMGGNQLSARVVSESANDQSSVSESSLFEVILHNVMTEDDVEDEDCLAETVNDIEELARQFGKVDRVVPNVESLSVSVHFTSSEDANKAVEGFHGMVIGGQTVSASWGGSKMETEEIPEKADNSKEKEPGPMFSGDKRIPERFAECKRVPKVPNSGQPRTYSVLAKHEFVKPLLVETLAELMRLQKRAIEEKNAKARRRLVMGLREVARGIRARKVRMVVMANNLDEYGVLDQKLQEILDLARKEEVPVFFEFSKRALGKAIGKSIKIAVIGIQNCDGADQQFKKLSALAPALPLPSETL